jgi:hypothetical protein
MSFLDAALVLGMIGVAIYGAVRLPPGAQVPIHFGPGSYNNWVPKRIGLLLWPAIGVALYVVLVVTSRGSSGGSGRTIGLTVALAAILVTEAGALKVALGRSGSE